MATLSPNGAVPAPTPYNVSLMPFSPMFNYGVFRDWTVSVGWNASYTGASYATARTNLLPGGIAYRRTQTTTAVSLKFQGTAMYLCLNAGGAPWTLTLDGNPVQTTMPAANDPICEIAGGEADTLTYARDLDYGSHSVILSVTASPDREFRFFGGAVEIGVQTGAKAVDDSQTIDDQDPGWIFAPERAAVGGWATMPSQRGFNSTATFECTYGHSQSAAYTFSGAAGALLLGNVWPNAHTFSVQLDASEPINLSATSYWYDGSAVFYVASGLDPAKEHTITIRNFNSDVLDCPTNPPRTCCTGIDAIRLLRAGKDDLIVGSPPKDSNSNSSEHPQSSAQPENPNSGPTNAPAIAGGVVGAVATIAIAGALAFLLLRRRRAASSGRSPVSDVGRSQPMVTPYAAVPGSVAASDGKREHFQRHAASDQSKSQPSVTPPGTSIPPPSRLAQQDLEQVLAFVAQRMDPGGRAQSSRGVHGPDDSELPQYDRG